MPATRSIRFAPDTEVLAHLRQFAVDAAEELRATADVEDLRLLVGELAANAALHQRGEAELVVSRTAVGGVRVEVRDHDPTIPDVVRHAPWDTEGHRGLFLVEAISARWGAEARPDGKVVWAELAPADQRVD